MKLKDSFNHSFCDGNRISDFFRGVVYFYAGAVPAEYDREEL